MMIRVSEFAICLLLTENTSHLTCTPNLIQLFEGTDIIAKQKNWYGNPGSICFNKSEEETFL
ncbi:hypothetical protein CHS0354_029043, partial [Potamilus streckersoni]